MTTYTVQAGDTLQSIAADQMGDAMMWQYLASINKLQAPYELRPGDLIVVDVPEVKGKLNWTYIILGLSAVVVGGVIMYYRSSR